MPSLVLDTHVWLWWLLGQPELSATERDALDAMAAAGAPPGVSAISLWEAQMLVSKGRLELDGPLTHWLPTAAATETVQQVLAQLTRLCETSEPVDGIALRRKTLDQIRQALRGESVCLLYTSDAADERSV